MAAKDAQSVETLSQLLYELDLVRSEDLREVSAALRREEASADDLLQQLMRRELLTSYQAEKLRRGGRTGFFYGNNKVQYLVGSGTFARVYRAVDRLSGQVVAVKVLRKRFCEEPEKVEQFIREGEMGQTLRHANIVTIQEVHRERGNCFIVMEFVEGQNLREFIRIRKKLDPLEATRLTLDVSAGLAYAFNLGICHRDLKMSNVLVSTRGTAKLVDFGLAGAGDPDDDEELNPRTVDYAGLEKASGAPKNDARSDLYFLGTIYYNLLTGEAPLTETKDRQARQARTRFTDIPPILRVAPTLPEVVAVCVGKAMTLDPARRYQTPGEFAGDLTRIMDYLAARPRTGGPAETASSPAHASPGGPGPAKILGTWMFVESNPKLQDMMREGIKRAGYRLLVTADPKRALARFLDAVQEKPDGVIISTGELGRSGLEVFNQLAAEPQLASLPAILLLGEDQAAWEREAQLGERRAALVMPVRFQRLRELLQQLTPAAAKP